MISAEEARKQADKVVKESPEFQSILSKIEEALEAGHIECTYTQNCRISSRVQELYTKQGYSFEYNEYTYNYIIRW